jgi:hypothetical protein
MKRAFVWSVTVVLALVLAGHANAAVATKKHSKKKAQASCPPMDVSGGSRACYRLSGSGPYGRCEPQSLPYARCRTGIMRCQGNCETSPIGWFHCEEKLGKTSARPHDESVMILGDNSRHRMKTGHVFVVEKARDLGGGHWELTLSHTNYDRRCSIETNVQGRYDEHSRVLAMNSGHWSAWGKQLSALGFILK